jgi:polar amino acid transport system substrate-binding protein
MLNNASQATTWRPRLARWAAGLGLSGLLIGSLAACSASAGTAGGTSSPKPSVSVPGGVDKAARNLLPASIKQSNTLIDGIQAPNPPMEYSQNGSSNWEGFDIDIVKAIAAKLGITTVTFDNQAFVQLLPSLTTNRVQIVASGLSDLKSREGVANFIDYFKTGAQLFTSAANYPKASSWASLCGQTIEVNVGTSYIPDLQALSNQVCHGKPSMKMIVVGGTIADQELQIKTGRAIAAVTAPENVGYLSTISPGDWKTIGPVFAPSYYGIAFAKSDVALFNAATRAFGDLLADGAYAKIAQKWHVTGSEVATAQTNLG